MFRLIKLALYGLIGYAIFEFIRGLTHGREMAGSSGTGLGRREYERALDRDTGRTMNMTGPARGQTVATEEASGESVPHRVGRGVVPNR